MSIINSIVSGLVIMSGDIITSVQQGGTAPTAISEYVLLNTSDVESPIAAISTTGFFVVSNAWDGAVVYTNPITWTVSTGDLDQKIWPCASATNSTFAGHLVSIGDDNHTLMLNTFAVTNAYALTNIASSYTGFTWHHSDLAGLTNLVGFTARECSIVDANILSGISKNILMFDIQDGSFDGSVAQGILEELGSPSHTTQLNGLVQVSNGGASFSPTTTTLDAIDSLRARAWSIQYDSE